MAGNSRDEILRFVYATTGDQDLANTANLLVKMADAGKLTDEEAIALAGSLKSLAAQTKAVNDALSQKAGLAETATKLQVAQEAFAKLNAETDKSITSSKKYQTALAAAEKSIADLTTKQNLQQVALVKNEGALQKAGIDTTNLAAASAKLAEQAGKIVPQLVSTGEAAAAAAKGTKDAADGTKTLGDRSKEAGGLLGELKSHLTSIVSAAAAVELALKAIEFGRESFSGAAEVEQSLARVKAIAQSTAEEFEQLSEQIDASAIAANASTKQSGAAAAALAEQGETAREIFQTLTPTLLLAKDAQIEVAQAAGIVDDALDLFGKQAGDAALVVDQLVLAAKGSKDGIVGLAGALKTLAPDAQQLGLSFEQLIGLLGLMEQNGLSAEKATRGLRTVFQDLQDPSSKLSLALARLGDSSGNFSKAIETLRSSGKRGQDALLGLDGAARSLVLFLLRQAPGAADTFAASLANAAGEASKTAKVLDDTLLGSFTSFENSVDRLGEGLLKASLGPLQQELQKLAGQLTDFAKSPAFANLEKEFADLFKQAVEGFDKVVQNIHWDDLVSGATDAVGKVGKAARDIGNDAKTIAESINLIAAAIGKLNAASDALTGGGKAVFGTTLKTITEGAKLAGEGIDAVSGKTSDYTKAVTELDRSAADVAKGGLKQFADGARTLAGATEEATSKTDALSASFKNVKDGAQTSDQAADIATAGFDAITGSVQNAATALGILPELFGVEANATNAATAAHNAHTEALAAARKAVDAALASLVKLAESGDRNSEAFLQASTAFKSAQDELDKLTGKSDEAAEAQRALEQAFTGLHITSQAVLEKAASDAKDNFETIKAAFLAGKATIEDTQRAYAAYAATVKAAFADSSASVQQQQQSQLNAQAAALGLQPILVATGRAGEDAGKKTAGAFTEARDAIAGTSGAVKDFGTDVAAAAIAADRIGQSAQANATAIGTVIALTVDQQNALKEMNEELERTGSLQNIGLASAKNILEQIGGLIGAQAQVLAQRIGELEAIAQQAEETAQRMKDEAADLQDQIDQLQGNDVDIEDRRHEKKLADLETEADADGALNTAAYANLVELENKLHALKLKNLQQEGKTNNRGGGSVNGGGNADGASDEGSSGGGLPDNTGGTNASNAPPRLPAPAAPSAQYIFNAVVAGTDQASADQFVRFVEKGLKRLGLNRF